VVIALARLIYLPRASDAVYRFVTIKLAARMGFAQMSRKGTVETHTVRRYV
jgi:hypothetical protein